ncbi:MAG: tRNA (guanosine(37)-N1)-methyltransferase TrmD [Armatimonadota bacterium]
MRIDIVTIFPEMVEPVVRCSMLARGQQSGALQIHAIDLRQFTHDRHRTTDDAPFGGGAGMVMKPEPFFEAVEYLREQAGWIPARIVVTTPQGRLFTQKMAADFAQSPHLILLCGHYEGIDERVCQYLATDEVSIGDYVLTGGELPALVIADAVARLVTGVLGNPESLRQDSFVDGLLAPPQYTRPAEYRGYRVPEVLLSGHHAKIARWRRLQRLLRTRERRPDLWEKAQIPPEDLELLREADVE